MEKLSKTVELIEYMGGVATTTDHDETVTITAKFPKKFTIIGEDLAELLDIFGHADDENKLTPTDSGLALTVTYSKIGLSDPDDERSNMWYQ